MATKSKAKPKKLPPFLTEGPSGEMPMKGNPFGGPPISKKPPTKAKKKGK